ncbi:MAG TPA: VOC family protein [Thermoleophilaceae bacterium]
MTDRMPSIHPIVRYRDVRAGMEFLVRAFGFEAHEVHEGPDGELAHVELRHDNGIVMLSGETASRDEFAGEAGRSWVYVVVEDADAHHDRAQAAGAEIVTEPISTDYGSRDYSARDIDGNLWSFGTYRPSPAGSA